MFWLENPLALLDSPQILPSTSDSSAERGNALTRLVLIFVLVLVVAKKSKMALGLGVFGLFGIIILHYMQMNNTVERYTPTPLQQQNILEVQQPMMQVEAPNEASLRPAARTLVFDETAAGPNANVATKQVHPALLKPVLNTVPMFAGSRIMKLNEENRDYAESGQLTTSIESFVERYEGGVQHEYPEPDHSQLNYDNLLFTQYIDDNVEPTGFEFQLGGQQQQQAKPSPWNTFDPRSGGYGDQSRAYYEPMTGQTRFYYGDIDTVRAGGGMMGRKDIELASTTSGLQARQEAHNRYHKGQDEFRNQMMQRAMNKYNTQVGWQRRQAPKMGNIHGYR